MKPQRLLALLMLGASLVGCNAQAGRLANLTVYDRTEGRALQMYTHQGKAYVVGKPGNEYQLSLANRSRDDLLAVVSVDGVNVVTGKTAASDQNGYVYDAGRSYAIQGWRKSSEQTAAFFFTSLSDSYAARTGRPGNVGVIGVALFQRKAPPPPPPVASMRQEESRTMAEERAAPAPSASQSPMAESENARKDSAKLGTGHGRIETSHVDEVEFERASSRPAEVITVYYDSYANLVARGVIRTAQQATSPQPFPGDTGFVPDPPAR